MRDLELLIFDMDGVLVDTTPCHRMAYEALWRRLGLSGPTYEQIAGRKTAEVVAEFTADRAPAPAQLDEWTRLKQARARECLAAEEIVYPDTSDCLEALAGRGFRLALGTSASRETTGLVLGRLGHAELFSIVVTGEDVEKGKPAPDIYLKIIARAGVDAERALIVEDSHSGLAAAVASGAWAASVRTGARIEGERFIGSFPDLRGLLSIFGGSCL